MMIALISRTHKGEKERGEVNGEYGGIQGKEKGDADYGWMVQPSQQHVAPCVKGLSEDCAREVWVLVFRAGIPVEVAQEAGYVLRL